VKNWDGGGTGLTEYFLASVYQECVCLLFKKTIADNKQYEILKCSLEI